MGRLSVTEAAALLGVHPQRIHQRIRVGSLPAERIGSQWAIDEADLELVRYRRAAGRPLSARSAWALAAVASDDQAALAQLSPSERSRARTRLRALMALGSTNELDSASATLAVAMGNRARRALFVASVRDLPDMREDERLRLSGVSLPGSNISAGQLVEGYVRGSDFDGLVRDYLLAPADRHRANVILHVVDIDVDDAVLDGVAESLLIRAADLSEHVGVREKDEAMKAIAQLHSRSGVKDATND
ncbi:helix-turn-helix domain-containing protein [Aeromicrobium sp. UC242_57]|uniref:helix-turn-helix domain-containing protein n=1 Tax=Aeromicrobium sp. UC242_57 TaxID=3374624 RepID=UPI0037AFDB4A